MNIFHIVDRDVWAAAEQAGAYRPDTLDTESFVHFSFAHQVLRVHAALYRGVPNLVVLEVDPALVAADVRVEDSYGAGETFPHVYGAVPKEAVIRTRDLDDPVFGVSAGGRATPDR